MIVEQGILTSDGQFESYIDYFFQRIVEHLEDTYGSCIEDIISAPGIVEIIVNKRSKIVINQHIPMKQIWYASPLSGASHFKASEGEWVSTQDHDKKFINLLQEELSVLLNQSVKVPNVS
ncbi:MAG: iron donor protein CyaY [Alphaproteobacteria bacterium]|nr:iron donor protein CyaY [Alphaproteobacteria bacterium]OJV46454.1 MAG: iron donor protein CyaY [Alphaproteobacteria bacterium 43-37]